MASIGSFQEYLEEAAANGSVDAYERLMDQEHQDSFEDEQEG